MSGTATDDTGKMDNIEINDTTLYGEAPVPANGDPYVAVLMATNENGVATKTQALTLGTGFESISDIAREIQWQLSNPEQFDHGVDFFPDRAEIFGVSGSVEFNAEHESKANFPPASA